MEQVQTSTAAAPSAEARGIPRRTLFGLFFLSGFASLIYQVVWTRMAFASFGIITPVLSVVLSVFMGGLAVGSWVGGAAIGPLVRKTGLSAAVFYGGAEFLIGVGAFAVPHLFSLSSRLLLPAGEMNSLTYLLLSAAALALSILPWCFCMGTTFPFMMAYVRQREPGNTRSFSFLYLANVLGAMAGTFLTAFAFVELLGFRGTLEVAAGANFTIAVVSAYLGAARGSGAARSSESQQHGSRLSGKAALGAAFTKLVLFSTGFISLAMEVVWSRAFTVILKTQVYSFAAIVFAYLGATFLGSLIYRRHLRRGYSVSFGSLFALVAISALLPVVINDIRVIKVTTSYLIDPRSVAWILGSICPLCALLGYLTPRLVDDYSAGEPKKAGEAYAINVIGCILGPLVAGYLLLPWMSQDAAIVLLSLPLAAFWIATVKSQGFSRRIISGVVTAAIFIWAAFFAIDFERAVRVYLPNAIMRRDYVASVISAGRVRKGKMLLVNGFGMTSLTPITKFMADLPIGLHRGRPKSVLVICFGMGTTFRTALSWNIDTTAVELVPSVVKAFGFYHPDAEECLKNPLAHVVIDDGRRYLKRCDRKFDVIIVDPPPPVEAAGSSLLYTPEFYSLVKEHLNAGGVVQLWDPAGPGLTTDSIIRSMYESFPYMRCYESVEGFGLHLLASMQPIDQPDASAILAKMPETARVDLMQWGEGDPAAYIARVLDNPYPVVLNEDPSVRITDDHPFNEYFLLRKLSGKEPPN